MKERIDNRLSEIMSGEEMQLKGTGSFIQTSIDSDTFGPTSDEIDAFKAMIGQG